MATTDFKVSPKTIVSFVISESRNPLTFLRSKMKSMGAFIVATSFYCLFILFFASFSVLFSQKLFSKMKK